MKKSRTIPKLPPRKADSHKNDYGHVAVVAGSRGMTGAAALTCQAALRAGAGLVTLGVPASVHDIMEIKLTEVMTRPLKETRDGTLAETAQAGVTELMKAANVLAIGPGLSRNRQTASLVRKIVAACTLPMVIDADALNALAIGKGLTCGEPACPERSRRVEPKPLVLGGPAIFTPHPGEFAGLAGISKEKIAQDRLGTAGAFAKKHGTIVVLKGNRTVVTDGATAYVNRTGNPGMATAGSGDVLTGLIAGCLAQGMAPFASAVTGVYLHGLAGDLAARRLGETSLIASDILEAIPNAVRRLQAR